MAAHGYFITFSTYGSRLQGDPRGAFRRDGSYCSPSPALMAHNDALRVFPCVTLDSAQRVVVRDAVVNVAKYREWDLVALHVRTQHVHTVVRSLARPERVLNDFKGWSTRALREAQLHAADARVWAGHGSTVYLWSARQVEQAAEYVFNRQGEPMERFP